MMDLEQHGERLLEEKLRLGTLSNRERTVYDLLLLGVRQYEIGYRLALSPKTINTYKTVVQGKLLCNSDVELVKFGVRHGLVDVFAPQPPMDQKYIFLNMKIPVGPSRPENGRYEPANSVELTTSDLSGCGFFTK
jgi:DNA-binding CsgD family transcriptional regulator